MLNVSKMGNTKSFSKAQFMVHCTERIRNVLCYFPRISSMIKYKADSFNLCITDSYVKRTIVRCIPQIENIKNH